jgi:hypothetical protein
MAMKLKKTTIISLMIIIVYLSSITVTIGRETIDIEEFQSMDLPQVSFSQSNLPNAIVVSDSNPFYALIATPIAVHYDALGNQQIIPLYIMNFNDPSEAIIRAKQQIGIYPDFSLSDYLTPKEASIYVISLFWDQADAAMIIKDDEEGYNLGVIAAPISSYLGIPIIITDEIDNSVEEALHHIGVNHIYICGDLQTNAFEITHFSSIDFIVDTTITIHQQLFNEPIDYITLTNPMDTQMPQVLDTYIPSNSPIINTIASSMFLPTQLPNMIFNGAGGFHSFTVPTDYKYARIIIDLKNLDSEHVSELGDRLIFLLLDPDGNTYAYSGTMGGLAEWDKSGDIISDRIYFETIIYDKSGEYNINVFGRWFSKKMGSYQLDVTVEKLDSPIVPLMSSLSSIAPYITAYHKGIIYGKPEYAFAADDNILYKGESCPGVSQPGTNPLLLEPSNQHTYGIHEDLNDLLSKITGIPDNPISTFRNYFKENPVNIAIAADPTMIPMYFYDNPDGRPDNPAGYMMGFALPSDFIYGNVDPDYEDPENDTESYWPFQENIVARLTGWDIQDLSALIARTLFYDLIIDDIGLWKENALVSTGCGLEFQNLPIITRISHLVYGGRGEPTKFPTGESTFINLKINDIMSEGYDNTKSTFNTASQREGFTKEDIELIKQAGFLNKLLFPGNTLLFLSSDSHVTGGNDQINSNLIFVFAHGFYNIYEHGDILLDARGFPFVTIFSRIYPPASSGLNSKGTFDVRNVEKMDLGPSVIFVVSCITGRTDGINGYNTLSQAYLHAGVNCYIGATRVTADPGYLEPRLFPNGLGTGTIAFVKTLWNYIIKHEYPDFHFGAVIAEDFISDLINHDYTTGLALRNAKNKFLPKDANSTFLWSPPLSFTTGEKWLDDILYNQLDQTDVDSDFTETRVLDKKYVAFHEFTLYGDPAFNPYQ